MGSPTSPAAQRTPLEVLLKRIFGEDQSKGIEHLAETFELNQALDKRSVQSSPYCAIVPHREISQDGVQKLDDSAKIALVRLLHSLADAREDRPNLGAESASAPNGFTWEELQSLFMQASFLEPVNDKQPVPKSIQAAGKRKICWFRKDTEPGIPKSRAIFELLRVIVDKKGEARTRITGDDDIDITPIERLLSRPAEQVTAKQASDAENPTRKKVRGRTVPLTTKGRLPTSSSSRAQSYDSTLPWHGTLALAPPPGIQPPIQEEPLPITQEDVSNGSPDTHVLNTSSSQKYSLSWADTRSPSSWTAVELITLKFPASPEDPNFTISRLTVTSWTSFDRRLIIPRAQTVVRIEHLSREFRARADFIKMLPESRRKSAVREADSLFKV
ncbi:hypothetical protein FA13DRAFT_1730999 [Coprinellus micaceus]|uniref:Uncharacterized protein n=1 Tax=Coprinellus micaceus TaxID=71717 RepID=A0A4Y7TH39_COPMI|nr:hypothetical protein FA13DRAFT_1730999 [Coprinellus micaceus]